MPLLPPWIVIPNPSQKPFHQQNLSNPLMSSPCSFACTMLSKQFKKHGVCLTTSVVIYALVVCLLGQYQTPTYSCTLTSLTVILCSFMIFPCFRENLDNIPTNAEELSFGNSVYKITFDNRERPVFGHKYWFFLQDAVENVPEYVVRWDNFVQYVFDPHPSFFLPSFSITGLFFLCPIAHVGQFISVVPTIAWHNIRSHRTLLCLSRFMNLFEFCIMLSCITSPPRARAQSIF